MKARFISLTVFASALVLALCGCQRRFAEDVRLIAANQAKAFEICTFRNDVTSDCVTLQQGTKPFFEVLSALAEARATLPPGKVPITKERVLRVVGQPAGRFSGCYRLIEFAGFPSEYINEVIMNENCTKIDSYESAYATTSRIG
jgi:hypothetical protein